MLDWMNPKVELRLSEEMSTTSNMQIITLEGQKAKRNWKVHIVKTGFSTVWMWELDHKEGGAPKKWCFQIVVLENSLTSSMVEIKPVNPKGNQPWIFIGRTDAEAETSIIWPRDAKTWLTGKDPAAAAAAKSLQSCPTLWVQASPKKADDGWIYPGKFLVSRIPGQWNQWEADLRDWQDAPRHVRQMGEKKKKKE